MATLFGIIIAVLITIASFSSKKKERVLPKVRPVGLDGGEERVRHNRKRSQTQDSYPTYREPEAEVSDSFEKKKTDKKETEKVIDLKKAIIYSAILERPYNY